MRKHPSVDLTAQVQVLWRFIKENIRQYATRGDKVLPFLLKFRDIVERFAHHLMVERLVACAEAKGNAQG